MKFDEVHLNIENKKQQSALGGSFCCDSLISLGFAGPARYPLNSSQSCEFRGSAHLSVSATKGLSVFATVFTSWFSSMHRYHWELVYFISSNCMHDCHFSLQMALRFHINQWILSYCTSVEVLVMALLILFVKSCTIIVLSILHEKLLLNNPLIHS